MALSHAVIVSTALELIDERGLDALSLRQLASRLGVQAPTLYWHVASKAALLDAVSDAIMDEALAALPEPGEAAHADRWLAAAFTALRAALLGHRDGARIVSVAHDSLKRPEFMERVLERLREAGLDPHQAWILAMIATRYTLGHVLAEQGADAAPSAQRQAEFEGRFPLVHRQSSAYFAEHSAADLFTESIALLLRSVGA
jgi:TetR/AcrR family tetracycline transcriptional repressor